MQFKEFKSLVVGGETSLFARSIKTRDWFGACGHHQVTAGRTVANGGERWRTVANGGERWRTVANGGGGSLTHVDRCESVLASAASGLPVA
ncbi:hypothetical protein CA13_59560 [Planctomycetes bacterium CA13]|uniref:Uncharacterized protein n=1 Tax=Novipirellula herctigrandis TaxID=2527986 RepID=A0A5C5ZBF9_9BACT|nr:hypothetical protein CA13_59560 [Planctomycetes bacterium CA13]